MPQSLTSESEEGSEEREESSSSPDDLEELKEFVTLAFVRENTQKRLQNAQQHGKKKRKRKRLVSENEEAGWGRGEGEMGTGSVLKRTGRTGGKRALAAERRRRPPRAWLVKITLLSVDIKEATLSVLFMESHNSVYNLESHLVLVFALFVCKGFLKTGWGGSSLLKVCKRQRGRVQVLGI